MLKKLGVSGVVKAHGKVLGWTGECLGRSLAVTVGNIDVIFTDLRSSYTRKESFDAANVDLLAYEIVVVKLGYLFTALKPYADRELFALSEGSSCVELKKLGLKRIIRPMFPLDEFEFDPYK